MQSNERRDNTAEGSCEETSRAEPMASLLPRADQSRLDRLHMGQQNSSKDLEDNRRSVTAPPKRLWKSFSMVKRCSFLSCFPRCDAIFAPGHLFSTRTSPMSRKTGGTEMDTGKGNAVSSCKYNVYQSSLSALCWW